MANVNIIYRYISGAYAGFGGGITNEDEFDENFSFQKI